ncbi:probable myosin-binding protein 4 [Ziziphus jujuba]|uniref:Probable myosin-binding protein 4 n=1 Tax=Ziziphus jujuba TaxID=326968 RepID=A0A6P4B0Y9_ZIZJJ|nr:probable myosin-binding protein 4 [Ziziphus jujuba]XP_015895443.3 probable myosin-binding protein 4 [Ziziphus jujuba]XP_048318348.2 probable myosin-binding protein 4 [Ziziphus jujuba]
MAANKFATMLHRNTNKITLILVYAILEWILIILLLLNSLFSFLIVKFADYFGLKRPCLWCSRLDHIFEPGKSQNFHRDLLCEAHASEISNLGYCQNHRKLAESQDMCEDCSSSSQVPECQEWSRKFAFFPWMKQIGMIQEKGVDDGEKGVIENGEEENSSCSCCGVILNSKKFYPPCILIKPSWDVLDYTQKENLILESGIDAHTDEVDHSDHSRSEFVTDHQDDDEQGIEDESRNLLVEGLEAEREAKAEEAEAEAIWEFSCREIVAEEDDEKVSMVMEKEKEQVPIEEEKLEQVPIEEEKLDISMVFDHQPREQTMIHVGSGEDSTSKTPPPTPHQHLEFFIGRDDCTLIPIGLVKSSTTTAKKKQTHHKYKVEESENSGNLDLILDFDMSVKKGAEPVGENWRSSGRERVAFVSSDKGKDMTDFAVFESMDFSKNGRFSVIHEEDEEGEEDDDEQEEEGDLAAKEFQRVAITQATQTPSENGDDDDKEIGQEFTAMEQGGLDSEFLQAFEDDSNVRNDETDAEISIGTEIPDQEPIDEIQTREHEPSYSCGQDEPATSSINLHVDDNLDSKQAEDEFVEFKTLSVETSRKDINNHLAMYSETEEEKIPDTPTSIDSLHMLHKKLFLLERRESATEDSLDGSVMSDIDGGDGVLTVEKLKSALRTERKTLNALYAELEEERSASAVAANQTMAMINRLQEEKAAMQMEALQYQRMMEEQSEYDQEALQLLNELMIKREKEKQELERELEFYRRRVQDYEAKEKMMLKRLKESSSRSCSNAEDSDGVSVDLNHEAKEEDSLLGHEEISNQHTPADAVLYLEESLANFEEERLSILDQLRVLEEKLFTLSDDDEQQQHFEDIKPIGDVYHENGNGYHESFDHGSKTANGNANGQSKEMNGKHHQESRFMASKAKRLLPLFDAIEAENEDEVSNGNGKDFDYVALHNSSIIEFEPDDKKFSIEEEVDHVYERLQALEADREFLKHCISSLRKGDKGVELLQEILQHLRDLRNVELRVKNMGDGVL